MAYVPHYQMTLSGVIGPNSATPLEIWSFGLQFGVPGLDGTSTVGPLSDSAMAALLTASSAYFNRASTGIRAEAFMMMLKVAQVGADGKYSGPPQVVMPVEPVSGNVSTSTLRLQPPQVTYAVSLTGPAAVTPRRGRWYVPLPAYGIEANTMGIAAGDRTAMVTSAKTFLTAVRTAVKAFSPTLDVVMAGADRPSKGEPPVNTVPASINVGSIYDTQRRRRNALVEARTTQTFP